MRPKMLASVLNIAMQQNEPILIVGSPGIGKTDIVEQSARALDYGLLITHPVVSDPTDFKGMPWVKEGNAEFLPYGGLRSLLEADRPTVAFMDDLGQAPPAVQAAVMQLLLAREINGQRISDHITFVAATNRKSDRAGVTGVLEPVKSRFGAILELEPNVDDWIGWALDNDMPDTLIAFVKVKPDTLIDFQPTAEIKNSPCPRTIAAAGRLMKLPNPPGLSPEEIDVARFALLKGAAGEGFATEFNAFMEVVDKMPDPRLSLQAPDNVKVPTEMSPCYAFSVGLARYVEDKTVKAFVKILNKMDAEYRVMSWYLAVRRDPDLKDNPAFTDFLLEDQEYLIQ